MMIYNDEVNDFSKMGFNKMGFPVYANDKRFAYKLDPIKYIHINVADGLKDNYKLIQKAFKLKCPFKTIEQKSKFIDNRYCIIWNDIDREKDNVQYTKYELRYPKNDNVNSILIEINKYKDDNKYDNEVKDNFISIWIYNSSITVRKVNNTDNKHIYFLMNCCFKRQNSFYIDFYKEYNNVYL